jgi:flagellar hook-associated protein 2
MSSFESPTFNIGGLASGLDTNAIVAQLVALEARPKVRLQQKQAVEEARQSVLRDVQTRLRNLSNTVASLRDPGTWGDVQSVESSDATKVQARRVGGAAAGGYTLQIVSLARAAQLTQGNGGGGSPIASAAQDDTLHITVGTTTPVSIDVAIAAGDSLQTIADKINSAGGSPVYASLLNGALVLSGKQTGADKTITVTDGDGGNGYDLATELGFTQTQAPANADFWVGTTHYTDRASNVVTDVMAGVELTLRGTTGTDTVSVVVGAPAANTETVKTKVQAFVDQYNSTVEFIRSKLNEERVVGATTDAERAKGVLRGDAGLTSLLSSLRASVSDVFTGRPAATDQLTEAGVSTGASTGSAAVSQDAIAGKLSLDATKLTERLAAGFDDAKSLFTKVTGSYDTEGLAQRLDRYLTPWLSGDGTNAPILSTRISAAADAITRLKDQMSALDARLALRERALRTQFTALEQALQANQTQSAWLSAQLAQF